MGSLRPVYGILLIVLAFVSISLCTVSAHILVSDGATSALLHIDPNDDPQVGATATLNFLFQTTPSGFDSSKCNCAVSIKENGKEVFSVAAGDPRIHVAERNISVEYAFPDLGAYTILFTGNGFSLPYDIEVRNGGGGSMSGMNMSPKQHALHIVLFGGAIAYGVYLIVTDRLEKRAYNKRKQNT